MMRRAALRGSWRCATAMHRAVTTTGMTLAMPSHVSSQQVSLVTSRRWASDVVPERRLLYENDTFLNGSSAMYLESLYEDWKRDPNSVDESWRRLFSDAPRLTNLQEPIMRAPVFVLPAESADPMLVKQSLEDCGRLTWMIKAFEERGHLLATTDPLYYNDADPLLRTPLKGKSETRLDLAYFGFRAADAERVVRVGFRDEVGGVLNTSSPPMRIKDLYDLLKKRFCGMIGFELNHILDPDQQRFVRSQVELVAGGGGLNRVIDAAEKRRIWDTVSSAVHFEDFFKRKFATQKRFGCDGAETLVLGLRALLELSATFGVEKINLGMAHRGRLNVLYHIIGKPFEVILKEFIGVTGPELAPFQIQSDVKYHLGARSKLPLYSGKEMQTEMLCNPSHLEAVNPLVQGYTKACQESYGGEGGVGRVLPIEIHGDAAFAGQGVAFESMTIAETAAYHTGGTIHVVCNNQIGFTTDPSSSRSSIYCTNLGCVFNCPVVHVNGDSPEDVVRVFEFAAEFRARFHKSVVIDLVCYRRYGHNESDDPSITQPTMYARIRNMPDIFTKYSEKLVAERVIAPADVTAKAVAEKKRYGAFQEIVPQVHYASYLRDSIPPRWRTMKYSDELGNVNEAPTEITADVAHTVQKALQALPPHFVLHPTLQTLFAQRCRSLESGEGVDWGTAEALAFASLMLEGYSVRVMGQDAERGAFAQRHAVLHNQAATESYTPLAHLAEVAGKDTVKRGTLGCYAVTNSALSEYGMLGYAAGYSLYDPNALVMWDCQYGDFANEATIIFDQFLSAGESKWNQQQSCVVTLPHGYDGKGPEHSSARLERFLQMSCEDAQTPAYSRAERSHRVNWELVYPSTPAQYFHLLRRHVKRDFRKALLIFCSKKYLGAPNLSNLSEFLAGSQFKPVIEDACVPPQVARRLVLCTGQIYHTLNQYRSTHNVKDVALVRIEELSPFPVAEVRQLLNEYQAAELMWAQEEPKNMGAWAHVEERVEFYTEGKRPLAYAGRATSASPATAHLSLHLLEEQHICETVFA